MFNSFEALANTWPPHMAALVVAAGLNMKGRGTTMVQATKAQTWECRIGLNGTSITSSWVQGGSKQKPRVSYKEYATSSEAATAYRNRVTEMRRKGYVAATQDTELRSVFQAVPKDATRVHREVCVHGVPVRVAGYRDALRQCGDEDAFCAYDADLPGSLVQRLAALRDMGVAVVPTELRQHYTASHWQDVFTDEGYAECTERSVDEPFVPPNL